MATIINFLITNLSKELVKLLTSAFDAIKQFFCYRKCKNENEKLKEETKQKEQYEKKVDNVVDKGTIEDLLDLRK